MIGRLKKVGIVLAVFGLVFIAGGVYAFTQVQAGQRSLTAFSSAQNVKLSYNEQGQLVDRGDTAEAAADHVVAHQRLGLSGQQRGTQSQ